MKEAIETIIEIIRPLIESITELTKSELIRSEARDKRDIQNENDRRERRYDADKNPLIAKLNDQASDLESLRRDRESIFGEEQGYGEPKKPLPVDKDFDFIIESQLRLIESTKQELVEHFKSKK